MALADACTVLDYMVDRLAFVLSGLLVYPDAMRRNLEATGGLVYSQRVLLALTEAWGDRERAYRTVQEHAMASWREGGSFQDRLSSDPAVVRALGEQGLASLFTPSFFTRNLGALYDRVLATEWGRA
ncbi:MAG: hypothetical protein QUU85_05995 [Candidatus Eisenbacteria bacterium]|nr:hypothetical protein [Candidatus Eisenbacteria bacterium]